MIFIFFKEDTATDTKREFQESEEATMINIGMLSNVLCLDV